MPRIVLLKDANISYDGITINHHKAGERLELSDEHVNNLFLDGACELIEAKMAQPVEENKAIQSAPENKEVKKRGRKPNKS